LYGVVQVRSTSVVGTHVDGVDALEPHVAAVVLGVEVIEQRLAPGGSRHGRIAVGECSVVDLGRCVETARLTSSPVSLLVGVPLLNLPARM
jgi:hypothetical protein